jgi:tRNA threonylcarbamoyladenosine biosynthesis protein TsaE
MNTWNSCGNEIPVEEKNNGNFTKVFFSRSAEETLSWGQALGGTIQPPMVVLLTGSLGTGKTVLVRGLASGLDLHDGEEVSSPSYTLMNSYQGRCRIHHLDLYRLSTQRDLENIGFFDLLGEEGSVLLIEWGEMALPWVPHGWHIRIEDLGQEARRFILRIY